MSPETDPPHRPQDVAALLAARVENVLTVAEREAATLQREVERMAEERAAEILLEAEREGQRILTAADERAARHLEETRARIDAYATDRIQRIHDTSERLLAAAEGLAERFEEALDARRGLTELVTALGQAAEAAAGEVRGPRAPLPRAPGPPP